MKNRKWICALLCVVVLGYILAGCNPVTPPTDNLISYEELYNGASTQIHPVVQPGELVRASYGYRFNTAQGYNGFYYVSGPAENTKELAWDGNGWTDGTASIQDGVITSPDQPCGYLYEAGASGEFDIGGTFRKSAAEGSDCSLTVYLNGTQVFPKAEDSFIIGKDDITGRYFEFACSLQTGDKLYFAVQGEKAYMNPAIAPKDGLDQSLYMADTDSGYYGDLHVYYHEGQVNLYHLWNYGTVNDVWEWSRKTTKDMFRYTDANYDTSFVRDHYMNFSRTPDLLDYSEYIDGRDYTLFYDADIDRYRYISLSYRQNDAINISCALTLRTSSDSAGMVWEDPCVVLRDFPTTKSGEPECSQFRKIGNRWYLFTSVSKQTTHYVGSCQYFIGGEGQTIDEVDWINAEPHVLDGEDICVPQVEDLGGRFYLFGWMPRVYNAGYWGGYKNLPREIYQREDGTLASRLDPVATSLLNKGSYFLVQETTLQIGNGSANISSKAVQMTGSDNKVTATASVGSSLVLFDVNMKNATIAGYTMLSDGKEYQILIKKKADGLWLEIGCPQDSSHKISSRIQIASTEDDCYSVKCIIDGGIVECYVNDEFALTGRTAMTNKVYTPSFISDAAAEFSNIEICRLAQLYDIYD